MPKLDLLVVGGGTAGVDAAMTAKRHIESVGIIEKAQFGGDCVFHACIPTKVLVHAARAYKRMKNADFFGLPVPVDKADYKKVKAHKDSVIAKIGTGRDEILVKAGIQLFRGSARFTSAREIAFGIETIRAEKIIVATGSVPSVPPIPGLKQAGYITNIEALEIERVPERLAIIGGGAAGAEFAQIFSSFGARVHIYEALDRILAAEDEEVSGTVAEMFGKQGIEVSTSTRLDEIKRTDHGKLIMTTDNKGQSLSEEFDEILVAAGRKPAIEGLNIEAAGIQLDRRGIKVNAGLQTTVPHIWAAGDVNGTVLFTFVAWEQGEVAAINAATGVNRELDYSILPKATFCDPEVASVGMTERQAREKGHEVKLGKFNYGDLTRPYATDEFEGFFKIVADKKTGRILGGHIVGAEASTLIHEVAAAMAGGLTVKEVGDRKSVV
jgi:pyruvate/2-oxoglutarate dehydrogenase complex dihydrolipoamide dehydrogenase (E3) component